MNPLVPRTIDDLFDLFPERGAATYLGEPVTQLEHAEQCAALAAAEGARDTLIVAAFLHDLGHLFFDDNVGGIDDRHESSGAAIVARILGDEVAGPIRLHVAAKRYLCARDARYLARLSSTSTASLAAQGGPLDHASQEAFLAERHAADALAVRRWDDLGKTPGAPRLGIEHVRRLAHELGA